MSLQSKNSVLPLIFGVVIGLLLGVCFNIDSDNDEDAAHRILIPASSTTRDSAQKAIWLQCLILIEPAAKNPHKHVSAILDTYASRCNDSLFFTNSRSLQDKFADSQANIFFVDSPSFDPSQWRWLYAALQVASGRRVGTAPTNDTQPTRWVAVLSERNYLVVRNFRHIVATHSAQPLIVGHIVKLRSVFGYLFPFMHLDALRMDGGVIISGVAIDAILDRTPSACSPNSWLTPSYAGKALLSCARKVGVGEWSPVDEETRQSLFVTTDLRTLFGSAGSRYTPSPAAHPPSVRTSAAGKPITADEEESGTAETRCCSHRVICFGSLLYHDLRLIHFFADNSLSVYGV